MNANVYDESSDVSDVSDSDGSERALVPVHVHVPDERDRLAAFLAHAGTLFAWFLAPLVILLLKRGESRWVEHHAMQSLLWSVTGTALTLVTCGLALPVFLVWHVIAAVKVYRGEDYDYPFVGDFSRGWVGLGRSKA